MIYFSLKFGLFSLWGRIIGETGISLMYIHGTAHVYELIYSIKCKYEKFSIPAWVNTIHHTFRKTIYDHEKLGKCDK